MKKLPFILSSIVWLILTGISFATEDGGVQSPFILGADARASGMGRAYVSLVKEPSAIFWNPAALTQVEQKGFNVLHSNLFWDTNYDFIGFCYPTPRAGAYGFGLFKLTVDDIEERDYKNNLLNPSLKNEQLEYIFSYSKQFSPSLSYGLSLKLNTHKIQSYSAAGVGLDVGVLYHPEKFPDLTIGGNLQNILEPSLKLKNDTTKYPINLKAGISYHWKLIDKLDDEFIISIDVDKSRLTELKWHSGIEYSLYKILSLRLGLDDKDFTYGFGIRYKGIGFDYACACQELKDTQKFTANLYIGQTLEQMRQALQKKEEEQINKRLEEELIKKEQIQVQLAMNKAKEYLEAKQYKEAIMYLERVLVWNPEDEEAKQYLLAAKNEYQKVHLKNQIKEHLEKGKNYLDTEEYLDAALEFKQVLILEPGNSYASELLAEATEGIEFAIKKDTAINQYFRSGVEAYTNGKLVESIAAWKQVLNINPNHSETLDYMKKATAKLNEQINGYIFSGKKYQKRKMWDKAISEVERALSLDPENKEAKDLVEEVKLQIAHSQKMVKINESRALTYLNEGIELYEAGEYEQANKNFQKALTLDKKLTEAQIYLKKSTSKLTELKEKELSSQQTKQLAIAYDKGLKYFHLQKITPAVKELEFVYKNDPDYREVKFYLVKGYLIVGMEHYTTGRLQQAINIWQKILTIEPENQKAISYITRTQLELTRIEEIMRK
ncbi:MAG: PorV/PorQ family protein [bacterium]